MPPSTRRPAAVTAPVRFLASRPAVLAAATIVLVCVPAGERSLSTAQVTAADIGSLVLVAVAGIRMLAGDRLPRSRLWWAVAAVAVGLGLATAASQDPVASAPGFIRYLQVFVLVPVATAVVLRDRLDVWLVCGAVLLAAVLEGAVGVGQYLTGTGASYGTRDVRAVGTFGALEVMSMASVVGYGMVVALGLAVVQRGRARLPLLAVAGLLVVPLLLSLSRGAAIATACAALVMLVWARARWALRSLPFAAALLVVTAAVAPGTTGASTRLATVATVSSAPDRSVADRYDLWRTAARMWQDHPVTGVGPRQFPGYRDGYAPLRLSSGSDVADADLGFQREPLLSPHNMYLLVLSEQGLAGALPFGVLLSALAAMTLRRVPARAVGARPARLAAAVAVGIVTWTLVSFAYNDIGGSTSLLISVLLGLALWRVVQPVTALEGGAR